jgi:dihydroflavonol-4-reductase
MKVFVTGGNGFIGSVVVRELIARGHEVHCLVRAASRTERIDGLAVGRVLGDVSDLASLRAAMAGCDCTIHLAAPSSWDGDDAAVVRRVIEGGTYNVLAAAGELPGHRVLFVSSTAAVNGANAPRVFDEQSEFTLRDPGLRYAHAKHRAEIQAREAFRRGVPVVIVNPAEVYGPGDTGLVTAGNLIDFATSDPVLVCRGGTSIVHVADVAAGIVAALERGQPGERYILAGENVTIRQLAELCLELLGRRARIVTVPNRMARAVAGAAIRLHLPLPFNPHVVPYATRYWFVDNGKACRELGLSFRGARETLGSTLSWLQSVALIPG